MQRLENMGQRWLPWLLAVVILISVGGLPAFAQASPTTTRTLVVNGYGHDQAPTTLAEITLGLTSKADSAKATYTKMSKRTSDISKLLKARKAKTIKMSNVRLDLKYGRDGKPQKDDYEGYQTIEFQVPTDDIGILDDAIALNIDRVQNIRYLASEQDLQAARNRALEAAIDDAQAQAKVALEQLDFTIQDIVDIQVNDAIMQAPDVDAVPKVDSGWSAADYSGNLAVEDGEQTVDVKVTLKVKY